MIEVLDRVEALAKETPPVDNATSRFGNPAFRTFYDKVQQVRETMEFQGIRTTADLPTFAGCTAISGASAESSTFGSYYRGVGIFLRVVGEQGAH